MYCYHYNPEQEVTSPALSLPCGVLLALLPLYTGQTWLKSSEVVSDGTNGEAQAVIFAANVTQTHHLIKSNKV